jgi:hypothetical protein
MSGRISPSFLLIGLGLNLILQLARTEKALSIRLLPIAIGVSSVGSSSS